MPHLLLTLMLLCFSALYSPAAHAGARETLERWEYVQDPDSGASFSDLSDFLDQHPAWPDQKRIQTFAERAIRSARMSDADIIAWFSVHPPQSGFGKWTYAEALKRQQLQQGDIAGLVREGWRDADLTQDEEGAFLDNFGKQLSADDHIARADRLLWEGKITQARRMMSKLPVAHQVLFQARISLQQEEKKSSFLVNQVSSKLKDDAGLMFDRMQYRAYKKDKAGVRDILLSVPKTVPYPERWWKIRESEIRRAIDEGNFRMASRLLSNHGQSEGTPFADALWLDGWLKLEFLGEPAAAYEAFYHMYDAVRTPVSKARAAYWTARAAEKTGKSDVAREWYSTAAQRVTTFYGQLAQAEIGGSISLPDEPSTTLFSSSSVVPSDLHEAIRISIESGDSAIANRLITHVMEKAENEHSILAVAALGHELSAPHISVKAAKKAQQKGVVLKNVGYPRPDTDSSLPIERALTLAITRQESEFDPHARSSAGALGMMQLLPGTARETAKKGDMKYNKNRLYEPAYNMRLGSMYLGRMISAYEGSYVMAIAAYNAGPGNVRKWMKEFGMPGSDVHSAVNWIEKIPFSETRNYVQRVMENLQVYRALEGGDKLAIREDLTK